jgi:hypothetical protein
MAVFFYITTKKTAQSEARVWHGRLRGFPGGFFPSLGFFEIVPEVPLLLVVLLPTRPA